MTSKLLPRALVFSVLLALGTGVAGSRAQSPSPTPTPTPPPRKPSAYLRLWNMAFALNSPLELFTGAERGGRALLSAPPSNFYTGYERVVPGHYSLRISRPSDPQEVTRPVDAVLPDSGYFTVLVSQQPTGEILTELVNDSPDPAQSFDNVLVVRQYSADCRVVVSAGGKHTEPLEFGGSQMLGQLPNGNVPVTMRAVTPQGPYNWASEVDFKGHHRATVFVYPDTYGRVRFKLTADGPASEAER